MFCSVTPICSAIAMKRLLNTSSMTGSTSVPIASAAPARRDPLEHECVPRRDAGAPALLDDDRLVRLDHQRRPVDHGARAEGLARVSTAASCQSPCEKKRVRSVGAAPRRTEPASGCGRQDGRRPAGRLDRHGFDGYRLASIDEAEAPAMGRLEARAQLCAREIDLVAASHHRQGRIGTGIAQMRRDRGLDRRREARLAPRPRPRLIDERRARPRPVCATAASSSGASTARWRLGANCGQSHAIGREQAGHRMDEDPRHAERVGDEAGMLPARAAKALQRVARHVVAARDRDLLDGIGHVLDGDGDEPVRDLLARSGRRRPRPPALRSRDAHDRSVERLRLIGTEDPREEVGRQLADHQVGVGDRQRAALAIAGGAGIGAGRIRVRRESARRQVQDRAATGRDRVDQHHRRAHAHARDLGLEGVARRCRHNATRRSRCRPCRSRSTRSKPSLQPVSAMPTTPPAGPDRMASLPRKSAAAVRPPGRGHEHQPRAGALDVELRLRPART